MQVPRPARALGLAALLAASWTAGGCAQDPEARVRLRLVVAGDVPVPAQVDRVRVTATSADRYGLICVPTCRDFFLAPAGHRPIVIDYFAGGGFDRWVFFRVEWYSGATRIAEWEEEEEFPASGAAELTAELFGECLAGAGCVDGWECARDPATSRPRCAGPLPRPSQLDSPRAPGNPPCGEAAVCEPGGDAGIPDVG